MKKVFDAKKRTVLSMTIVLIITVVFLLCAAGQSEEKEYKAVLRFPLYKQADFDSDVLIDVSQNAKVEKVGEPFFVEDVSWQKVEYLSFTGYTLSINLYISDKNDNYRFTAVKAKSRYMGEAIGLYAAHTNSVPPEVYVNDGERLKLVNDSVDYSGFSRVEYNGQDYFVYSDCITAGLSYNESLALIIVGSVVGAVAIGLLILLVIRKRKHKIV